MFKNTIFVQNWISFAFFFVKKNFFGKNKKEQNFGFCKSIPQISKFYLT